MSRLSVAIIGATLALVSSLGARAVADVPRLTPTATPTPAPTACPPGPLTMANLTGDVLTWPNLPNSAKPFEIDVKFCDQQFHYEVAGSVTSFRLPSEATAAIDCCGTRNILVSSAGLCSQAFVEVTSQSPLCLPSATATPAIQAPPTGYGDGGGPSGLLRTALMALGALLLATGLISFAAFRHGNARE